MHHSLILGELCLTRTPLLRRGTYYEPVLYLHQESSIQSSSQCHCLSHGFCFILLPHLRTRHIACFDSLLNELWKDPNLFLCKIFLVPAVLIIVSTFGKIIESAQICVLQVVKEAEDADVSDDDVNYPARVYAATELLERHCLGLRELLCQVGQFPMRCGNLDLL